MRELLGEIVEPVESDRPRTGISVRDISPSLSMIASTHGEIAPSITGYPSVFKTVAKNRTALYGRALIILDTLLA